MNTIDVVSQAIGPPCLLREFMTGSRLDAAVGRWRHRGARVDLRGEDTFHLIFNVSGGQRVELRRGAHATCGVMRAGSVGVTVPDDAPIVAVAGGADTLQIILTRRFVESVNDGALLSGSPRFAPGDPGLQAAAVQALVALTRPDSAGDTQLKQALRSVARRFARSARPDPARGGLPPASAKRVDDLIKDRMRQVPLSLPGVGELAQACGLSLHHFIKAFSQSRGRTPHAHMAELRLDTSLTLLLNDVRVNETAYATGFSSPSHFVSAFRARMGVTPGALREAAELRG